MWDYSPACFVSCVLPFRYDLNDNIVIISLRTAPRATVVFLTIRKPPFPLAFCAEIRIAPLAVQNRTEVPPAAAWASVVVVRHNASSSLI